MGKFNFFQKMLHNLIVWFGQQVVKDFQGLEPIECFYTFLPQTIFEHVTQNTNLYFIQYLEDI